jgi:hypothetical protein
LKETVHALLTGSLSFTIELVSLLHLLLLLLRLLFLWVLFLLLLLFCSSNRVQYHTPVVKKSRTKLGKKHKYEKLEFV